MADQNQESQNPSNATPNPTADRSKAHPDFKQQDQKDDQNENKDVRNSDPADQKSEQNTGTR